MLKPPPTYDYNPALRELAAIVSRDIYQRNPNVRWGDVVDLAGPKRLLKEAVVMPVKYPQLFTGAWVCATTAAARRRHAYQHTPPTDCVSRLAGTVEGCAAVWPAWYRQDDACPSSGNRVPHHILQHFSLHACLQVARRVREARACPVRACQV